MFSDIGEGNIKVEEGKRRPQKPYPLSKELRKKSVLEGKGTKEFVGDPTSTRD